MGSMPSFSSLLRSRKRSVRKHPDLTPIANSAGGNGNEQRPSIGKDPERSKPKFPTNGQVMKLRQDINTALDRVEALILSDDTVYDAVESCSVSVSMYIVDLERSVKALNNILTPREATSSATASSAPFTKGDSQILSSSTDQIVQYRRGAICLSTPALSFSEQTSSVNEYPHDRSMPALVTPNPSAHSTRSTARTLHVAPLKLPTRKPAEQSAESQSSPQGLGSPFQNELHALDIQISASSQPSRRYTTSSYESSPLHSRNRHTMPCPIPSSLTLCSPTTSSNVDASSTLDSSYLGSYHPRQFSTEEKRRRLRTLRASSASQSLQVTRGSMEDSLCMEELLGFLREGNSLREL